MWGEDLILDNDELIDHSQAVALTYTEAYTLRRHDLDSLSDEFPEAGFVVRKAASRIKLQRCVIKALCKATGKAPMSFISKSAANGVEEVFDKLKSEQKLDQILFRVQKLNGEVTGSLQLAHDSVSHSRMHDNGHDSNQFCNLEYPAVNGASHGGTYLPIAVKAACESTGGNGASGMRGMDVDSRAAIESLRAELAGFRGEMAALRQMECARSQDMATLTGMVRALLDAQIATGTSSAESSMAPSSGSWA